MINNIGFPYFYFFAATQAPSICFVPSDKVLERGEKIELLVDKTEVTQIVFGRFTLTTILLLDHWLSRTLSSTQLNSRKTPETFGVLCGTFPSFFFLSFRHSWRFQSKRWQNVKLMLLIGVFVILIIYVIIALAWYFAYSKAFFDIHTSVAFPVGTRISQTVEVLFLRDAAFCTTHTHTHTHMNSWRWPW